MGHKNIKKRFINGHIPISTIIYRRCLYMDNHIKLIILLFFVSFSCQAAWNTNFRGAQTAAQNNLDSRGIIASMKRTITAAQYKTINNFPQKAVFNAPVPYSAPATVSRGLSIPKATLGGAAKRIALGGARFGAYGIAFQAAVVVGEYAFEHFTEEERLADPTILDGDYKDISKTVQDYQGEVMPGDQLASSNSGDQEYLDHWLPIFLSTCNNGLPNASYSSCYLSGTDIYQRSVNNPPHLSETKEPMSPELVYDTVIDNMSDQEFEDFINNENVKPQIVSSPEFQTVDTDAENDFNNLIDTFPNGFPDTSTLPTTIDSNDSNFDSLTVPEYDNVPITDTTIATTPEYNTIIDTQTSTAIDTVNFTETKTIVTTTTTVDSGTGEVVDTSTKTETRVYPRPDLNPLNNPNPDPTSPNPDPSPDPTTSTTTTTNTGNPTGSPTQVEVTNFPQPSNILPKSQCEKTPNALGCLDVGDNLPKPPDIPEYEVPFEVTPFALTTNAQCPVPVSFTLSEFLGGNTYGITYQPICDFATMLKPLIIAIGFLISFFIISGTVRSEI